MSAPTRTAGTSPAMRWAVVAAIAGVAFFGSYRFAVAAGANSQNATGTGAAASTSGAVAASTSSSAASSGSGTTAASSGSSNSNSGPVGGVTSAGGCCGAGAATAGSTGGGCCGGGAAAAGAAITKQAKVAGGVQKISVDLSKGYYDPSTIQLKAGVPAEITFGQSSGCTGIVQSQQLGFSEDLSSGPKTVKIAALQPGTYQFACGMSMVNGTIVVK